jgi:cytochrome c biogenesis protein CcmG/thiol:disulfide interchange protein DsbE
VEDCGAMPSRTDPVRALFVAAAVVAAGPALVGCAGTDKGAESGAPAGLVGNPAPDFHVTAVTGPKGAIALNDLHGQVVLLDFWGTFCEPCKKSFPKLEDLNRKYASSGLRVIGISEDEDEDKDKIPAFAQTYGAKFSLAWDEDRSVAKRYKPETMPSSFIIDKEGIVRFAHVGFHDGEEVEVESEIRGLLGVK